MIPFQNSYWSIDLCAIAALEDNYPPDEVGDGEIWSPCRTATGGIVSYVSGSGVIAPSRNHYPPMAWAKGHVDHIAKQLLANWLRYYSSLAPSLPSYGVGGGVFDPLANQLLANWLRCYICLLPPLPSYSRGEGGLWSSCKTTSGQMALVLQPPCATITPLQRGGGDFDPLAK